MKYKPNLWTLVDKIQCSIDQKNIERREVFNEKSPRLNAPSGLGDALHLERELKNAFRL